MNEGWITKAIATCNNGAVEIRYNFDYPAEDVTLIELKAIAKFLNDYIKKEEEGGAQ